MIFDNIKQFVCRELRTDAKDVMTATITVQAYNNTLGEYRMPLPPNHLTVEDARFTVTCESQEGNF